MQIANVIHIVGATFFIVAGLGHIYMGTLGMVGAYDAMATGYVDETWAREHHLYWYNQLREQPLAIEAGPAEPAPRAA
jgi:formate dehydrogenase subunit gamma